MKLFSSMLTKSTLLFCLFVSGCVSQVGPSGFVELDKSDMDELIQIARYQSTLSGAIKKNQHEQQRIIYNDEPRIRTFYTADRFGKVIMNWNLGNNKEYKVVFQGDLLTDDMIVRVTTVRVGEQQNLGPVVNPSSIKSDLDYKSMQNLKKLY